MYIIRLLLIVLMATVVSTISLSGSFKMPANTLPNAPANEHQHNITFQVGFELSKNYMYVKISMRIHVHVHAVATWLL